MKSSKVLNIITAFLVCLLIVFMILCIISVNEAYEFYDESEQIVRIEDPEYNKEVYQSPSQALTTSLSITLNGGDGKVWATVKNDISFFNPRVTVIVQLYSRDFYAENYADMNLVCANSVEDLDVGKTISVEAETGGKEKFWLARMRFKIGTGRWSSRYTAACRLSASGEFLGYI